jgi:hypothetical protein
MMAVPGVGVEPTPPEENGIFALRPSAENPNRIMGKPYKFARYSEVAVGGLELELLGNVEGCPWQPRQL